MLKLCCVATALTALMSVYWVCWVDNTNSTHRSATAILSSRLPGIDLGRSVSNLPKEKVSDKDQISSWGWEGNQYSGGQCRTICWSAKSYSSQKGNAGSVGIVSKRVAAASASSNPVGVPNSWIVVIGLACCFILRFVFLDTIVILRSGGYLLEKIERNSMRREEKQWYRGKKHLLRGIDKSLIARNRQRRWRLLDTRSHMNICYCICFFFLILLVCVDVVVRFCFANFFPHVQQQRTEKKNTNLLSTSDSRVHEKNSKPWGVGAKPPTIEKEEQVTDFNVF